MANLVPIKACQNSSWFGGGLSFEKIMKKIIPSCWKCYPLSKQPIAARGLAPRKTRRSALMVFGVLKILSQRMTD